MSGLFTVFSIIEFIWKNLPDKCCDVNLFPSIIGLFQFFRPEVYKLRASPGCFQDVLLIPPSSGQDAVFYLVCLNRIGSFLPSQLLYYIFL